MWTLPPSQLRPASNRPDAIALDAAWRAVRHTPWRAAFAGGAQEVADRFTAWAQAASAMARNLAAEKHRARKFRQALDTFTGSATRLASRTQATARDSAAWAGVFAGIPAGIQAADPDPGKTATPDGAQPTAAPRPAPADETGTHPGHDEPAGNGPAEPGASPLTNSDLAAELRRLPGFARWLSQASAPPAAGNLDSQRPGAGSSAVCDERGIEITVSGPGFTRHGLVTWPQAASWIDNGVTPARLGLAVIADRLSTFCRDHRDQLVAAGTCDPDATAAELAQIRDTAVAMIVDAALRSRGAAVPVPPARPDDPAWYTAVMTTRPARAAGKAENAALERLTQAADPDPRAAAGDRCRDQGHASAVDRVRPGGHGPRPGRSRRDARLDQRPGQPAGTGRLRQLRRALVQHRPGRADHRSQWRRPRPELHPVGGHPRVDTAGYHQQPA